MRNSNEFQLNLLSALQDCSSTNRTLLKIILICSTALVTLIIFNVAFHYNSINVIRLFCDSLNLLKKQLYFILKWYLNQTNYLIVLNLMQIGIKLEIYKIFVLIVYYYMLKISLFYNVRICIWCNCFYFHFYLILRI